MVRKKLNRALMSDDVERPEIFQLADYIYKRPDHSTIVENYSRPSVKYGYEFNKDTRIFEDIRKYTDQIKSIDSYATDHWKENKARLLTESQYMQRRNHLFTSLNRDEETEHFYELQYSKNILRETDASTKSDVTTTTTTKATTTTTTSTQRPFVVKIQSMLSLIPRYDANLTRYAEHELKFNPNSAAYKFVSNSGLLIVVNVELLLYDIN